MYRRDLLRNTVASSVVFLGLLAGCTGNNDNDSATTPTVTERDESTTTEQPSTEDGGGTATVVVSSTEKFGDILTDSKGMTLYLFTKDKPGKSVCYDGCTKNWPPLIISETPSSSRAPSAGPEVMAQLDTIERKNGSIQVTIADHPLYYYAGDEMPGDTTGQGLGGVWFVVGPDGQKKTQTTTTATTTTTTTEDGDGYGGY